MALNRRPRRNRISDSVRSMVAETTLNLDNLIFPLFLIEGVGQKKEVMSMPGIYRYSMDALLTEIESCINLGLNRFCLFPSINDQKKDKYATESHNPEGVYAQALVAIKKEFPDSILITDVAMDPYSSDGHDGLVENGRILNDPSLEILGKMALVQAQAGADILGPSDMMDGRVGYLRNLLDREGYNDVAIMSYTAKYASAFYGPFRDALNSAPKQGDKKTYQMDPANHREALLEATLDVEEGADYLMVKPALAYLDIIKSLYDHFHIPIAAYQVSGEYAMVKAAAQQGWIENDKIMVEILLSIKRAGATAILTYFAKEYAQLVNKNG